MDTVALVITNVVLAIVVLVPFVAVLVAIAAELMTRHPAPAGGGTIRFRVLAGGRAGPPRAARSARRARAIQRRSS